MIIKIHPSKISGTLNAPASKSSMQRGCAAALLNESTTILNNPGHSNDDKAALGILRDLGADIKEEDNGSLVIKSREIINSSSEAKTLNCGESGLGIRMFAPLAALSAEEIVITGSGSLLNRPMDFFDEVFPQLQVAVQSNAGKLPLKIKGPLKPVNIMVDGSLSSQFLTGLLLAFGKAATSPVIITVNNLKSKPYIDLTLQVMKHFGYDVLNNNYESFLINPINHSINKPVSYTIEGDWSGGAFLLVAAAINGNITVNGLDMNSTQADKKITEALKDCGCRLSTNNDSVTVLSSEHSNKSFYFDATDCPDLFPPLVALASYCNGTSAILGVNRLAHKESNRGLTLQEEFAKMGIHIKLQGDKMLVEGGKIKSATVHSHHDHRIAMACAVAGLCANGETMIEEAEAINKSYPDFYAHLKKLGASIS